jgi:hypothetical protein
VTAWEDYGGGLSTNEALPDVVVAVAPLSMNRGVQE